MGFRVMVQPDIIQDIIEKGQYFNKCVREANEISEEMEFEKSQYNSNDLYAACYERDAAKELLMDAIFELGEY